MSIVLWLLLSALAVMVLLIGLVLMTPMKLALTMQTSPTWRMKIGMRLLGGLTPMISYHGGRERRQRKTKRMKTKPKATFLRLSVNSLRVMTATPQLLAGMTRAFHLQKLSIDADLGLGDPADTGQLFGMITAAQCAIGAKPNVAVTIRPDFHEPHLSGRLDAEFSLIPITLIPPGVRFAWQAFLDRVGDDHPGS